MPIFKTNKQYLGSDDFLLIFVRVTSRKDDMFCVYFSSMWSISLFLCMVEGGETEIELTRSNGHILFLHIVANIGSIHMGRW